MRRRSFLQTAAAATALGSFERSARAADGLPDGVLEVVGPDDATGSSQAVVVGDVPLLHVEQTVGTTDAISAGKAALSEAQVLLYFEAIKHRLAAAGSSLNDVVQFSFYLNNYSLNDVPMQKAAIEKQLQQAFPSRYKPAVTYMVGKTDVGLAGDCIAVYRKAVEPGKVLRFDGAAVLPPMNKLYVSGDAVPGTLMSVVGDTLASLEKTLTYCGLDWSHVVQLKTFMQPIVAANDVRREIQTWFGKRPVPVLSFVEWSSSEKIPIEIELIATVPPELGNKSGDSVEYLTPPHMKSSPVFSRAARVQSERTIYVSNVYGDSTDPAKQVRDVFGKLKATLEPLGSDLKHLVKATYYVTDDVISKALGEIRPEFYDPARPPAASKALVGGTGRPERSLTLDMIAVPRRRP